MTNGEIEHIEGAATLDSQHHDTTNEIKERVHRTVTYRQFCWALTFMFFVLAFSMSGAGKLIRGSYWFETEAILSCVHQVERLSDENNRLDNEINMVRHKLGYRNETILVYRGILEDRPELLELSKIENKNRSEQFQFINWSFPDKAIHFMYNVQSYECLEWVRRQPKWYSCLSNKSYKLIMEHTDGPVARTLDNDEHGK